MSMRCTNSRNFQARVAMEAICWGRTIQDIATDHAIHPSQVGQCQRPLVAGASVLFLQISTLRMGLE